MDHTDMELSVVVPVLNEEDNLGELYQEIAGALTGRFSFEILFVDDGSSDNSFEVMRQLQKEDGRIRVIRLRKNFGQTAALSAGFEHCRGTIVVPMDADGQNDPADIPALVEKLKEGYDIVSGWRKDRQDHFVTRKIPSWIANHVIAGITGVHLHDFGCTIKAYRRSSVAQIRLYGEMHRFIPALASWSGEHIAEMAVNHRPRTKGKAKYGLGRTFKVLLDLITLKFLMSFSTKPIYVFGGLGILCILGSFLSGMAVLYQKVAGGLSMNRNPLLLLTVMLFMTAVQFILMGLLAEMLVRTYHESQGRSIYVIDRIYEPMEDTLEYQT